MNRASLILLFAIQISFSQVVIDISNSYIHIIIDSTHQNYLFDQADVIERHTKLHGISHCMLDSLEEDCRNGIISICNFDKSIVNVISDITFQEISSLSKAIFYPTPLFLKFKEQELKIRINWYGDFTYLLNSKPIIQNYIASANGLTNISECYSTNLSNKSNALFVTIIVPDSLRISQLFHCITGKFPKTPDQLFLISESYAIENYNYYRKCFVHPIHLKNNSLTCIPDLIKRNKHINR